MTNLVSRFSGKNFTFFSIGTFILIALFLFPTTDAVQTTSNDAPAIEYSTCCDDIIPPANFFCPGNYQITGSLPQGCTNFQLLPNNRCSGITINSSISGNTVTLSGTVAVGAFCKFRYTMKDAEGNTCYYLFGIKALAPDSPQCCTTPPCQ